MIVGVKQEYIRLLQIKYKSESSYEFKKLYAK